MFDEAGEEMVLITLAFTSSRHGSWICVKSGANVEAHLAGHWKMLNNTVSPGSLGDGETRQDIILTPAKADQCRIHLSYAGASIPWRFGGWLSRRGVKLPPKYWDWAGWPRAEGQNPRWKTFTIEFPLKP
jgi:hypothetical protein